MSHYLMNHHVSDDLDDGMFGDTSDEDDKMERLYRSALPAVYSTEAPPPLRIDEDMKLETQYSEGSDEEEEEMVSRKGYHHITQMLRQVEPEYTCEDFIIKELKEKVPTSPTEDFTVILTKTNLNPNVSEYVPLNVDTNTTVNVTTNAPEKSPKSKTTAEHNNKMLTIDKEKAKARHAPRNNNVAMQSIMLLKDLEKRLQSQLKTPQDFLPSISSSAMPRVATPTVSTPIVTAARMTTPIKTTVDNTPSEVNSPKSALSTPTVGTPKSVVSNSASSPALQPITPNDYISNSIIDSNTNLISNNAASTELMSGSKPKVKKSKDFVPSAKTNKYYEKLQAESTKLEKQAELDSMRGRTVSNHLSGFIEVKLEQHKKEGGESRLENVDAVSLTT